MEIQEIKQRYGIIGNSPLLNRAIDIANQVAPTDISVLITGESGSGKEVFSQIIHQMSPRKHGPFIAVNCGAIPEGTIDSELFGHEKGAYTGAVGERKGYFETVNGGTIFLDEIAEMPIGTQARLLRVLESGQYIKVGSSKVEKTNVRVIAATNVDVYEAVKAGRFREDLYYRLNTVPLRIPPLRDRKEDIYLLFRKFTADFTAKYRSPPIQLNEEAQQMLVNYSWPGNVRQLKNVAEQLAVLERDHMITAQSLLQYIPQESTGTNLPMRVNQQKKEDFSERDILYKVLFDMKRDMTDLKKLVADIIENGGAPANYSGNQHVLNQLHRDLELDGDRHHNHHQQEPTLTIQQPTVQNGKDLSITHEAEEVEESLSLMEKESDLIKKALKKHKGKRKFAAQELGISERTLYRKIKELNLKLKALIVNASFMTKKIVLLLFVPIVFLVSSCGVYSLNGGSVGSLKTVNVMFFENVAPLVVNNLSQSFTTALQDRIRNQTRLSTVRGDADATFEGRITGYTIAPTVLPAANSTTAPIANTNRLTITVSVKYTNSLDPKLSFEQPFSRYQDYQGDIGTKEQTLIQAINIQLTEDIFNRAFANW